MTVQELARPRVPDELFPIFRPQFDALFDDLWRRNGLLTRTPHSTLAVFPSFDVSESAESYKVTADVPGLERKDVNVAIDGDLLVVSGRRVQEKDEQNREWTCRERATGEFRRAVRIPGEADASKATAAMNHGVLTIDIPKRQDALHRRRTIEVKQS